MNDRGEVLEEDGRVGARSFYFDCFGRLFSSGVGVTPRIVPIMCDETRDIDVALISDDADFACR